MAQEKSRILYCPRKALERKGVNFKFGGDDNYSPNRENMFLENNKKRNEGSLQEVDKKAEVVLRTCVTSSRGVESDHSALQVAKVLYCGMADDVLTPFLLVPELDHLYAIDLFDSAFARGGTLAGQMADIRSVLEKGNDRDSHSSDVYQDKHKPLVLPSTCTIVSETLDGSRWDITLKLEGKKIGITYFLKTDFYKEWDPCIDGITHVMSLGATFDFLREPTLNSMLLSRCVLSSCFYYDCWHILTKNFVNNRFKNVGSHGNIQRYFLTDVLRHGSESVSYPVNEIREKEFLQYENDT